MTLKGHQGSVLCLQYDDEYLVSGSSDCTIIIWDIKTGYKPLRKIAGHEDSVLNLRFDKKYIVSCSKDKTIKIWDTKTGEYIKTLYGHKAAVNAVQYRGDMVISGSGGTNQSFFFLLYTYIPDRTIKIWSISSGNPIRTLTGHERGIACIEYNGNLIASGSSDGTIRLWDARNGAQLLVIPAHSDLVRTLQFDNRMIISGSYDGSIRVWDMKGRMIMELREHAGRIFKVQFNAAKIVSCSQDQVPDQFLFDSLLIIVENQRLGLWLRDRYELFCLARLEYG